MVRKLREHLSYANVIASIALFVALGGGAYAAVHLPKNSVGAKQIKKNAVSGQKVKNHSLTGADIKVETLPKVQAAANADHAAAADHAATADQATSATDIAPPEPWHEVGTPGEPPFRPGAGNHASPSSLYSFQTAAFYKDREGVVHLKGAVDPGAGSELFNLPPGYRPATKVLLETVVGCSGCINTATPSGDTVPQASTLLQMFGSGIDPDTDGKLIAVAAGYVHLDGVSFRAGS